MVPDDGLANDLETRLATLHRYGSLRRTPPSGMMVALRCVASPRASVQETSMSYGSVTAAGVTLLCFPPHDRAFLETALRVVAAGDASSPADLEQVLRRTYPRVVARARDGLAAMGGGDRAWYVYRDGRYSPYASDPDWWRDPDEARLIVDDRGQYLDANDRALQLLGVDLAGLRAATPGAFTAPESRERVPWLMALLEEVRVLESTAILVPQGGLEPVSIQYRLMLDGDGEGRHLSVMRPIPDEDVALGGPPTTEAATSP